MPHEWKESRPIVEQKTHSGLLKSNLHPLECSRCGNTELFEIMTLCPMELDLKRQLYWPNHRDVPFAKDEIAKCKKCGRAKPWQEFWTK